jgi:hypothetical protein
LLKLKGCELVVVAAQGVAIVMAKKSAPSAASAAPVTSSQAADAAGRAPSGRRAEPSVELVESTRADMQAAEQLAAELAGIDMDEPDTEKQTAKSAPDEGTQAKPEATSTQADEAFNDDAPVLGDDDEAAGAGEADGAAETDDDDTPSEDDAPEVAALKKENFKQREKKRELEAQLKALADEKAELQRKLSTLETTPTVMPDLGIYAEAKSADEVAKLEDQQQQFADYVESLLDEVQEVYTLATHDGQERDFTRQQLRDYLRGARANVKLADKARNALKISAETEARAKVKYPFVFDAKARHNGIVLDLVKETPALNALPNKALLLGRLAIGKLVETGEYFLTKRGAKPAAAAEKAKPAASARPTVSTAPPAPRRSATRSSGGESYLDRLNRGDSNAAVDAALAMLEDHPGM